MLLVFNALTRSHHSICTTITGVLRTATRLFADLHFQYRHHPARLSLLLTSSPQLEHDRLSQEAEGRGQEAEGRGQKAEG